MIKENTEIKRHLPGSQCSIWNLLVTGREQKESCAHPKNLRYPSPFGIQAFALF